MQEIKRDVYLDRLVRRRGNGLVKIVTGIRRCGKSYLLDPIFRNHLLEAGVPADHIVKIELDRESSRVFHHDPKGFDRYIRSFIKDDRPYTILLDEVQLVDDFAWVLNGLLYARNLDIYVTGSNSRFLSSDIITEFRGRGDQINVQPLSFSEYLPACGGKDRYDAWDEYLTYGGMPFILSVQDETDKATYLKNLFEQVYFRDILERYHIRRKDVLDRLVDTLASSVGSLTNPQKIFRTYQSTGEKEVSLNTIGSYLTALEDAFIIRKTERYDIKGRKYIGTPQKYYFTDLGLRNARLNFRQQEASHLLENALYNELMYRGYNVDVGVVEVREQGKRIRTEVDFVCNSGSKRYYIQSALSMDTREKTVQESRPLRDIGDSFKKIIVVKDHGRPWRTEDGILVVGVMDFLLDPSVMDA